MLRLSVEQVFFHRQSAKVRSRKSHCHSLYPLNSGGVTEGAKGEFKTRFRCSLNEIASGSPDSNRDPSQISGFVLEYGLITSVFNT